MSRQGSLKPDQLGYHRPVIGENPYDNSHLSSFRQSAVALVLDGPSERLDQDLRGLAHVDRLDALAHGGTHHLAHRAVAHRRNALVRPVPCGQEVFRRHPEHAGVVGGALPGARRTVDSKAEAHNLHHVGPLGGSAPFQEGCGNRHFQRGELLVPSHLRAPFRVLSPIDLIDILFERGF